MDGETQQSQSVNQSGSGKKIVWFLIVVIVLAGIAYAVWGKNMGTPADTGSLTTPVTERPGAVKLDSSPFGPILTGTSGRSLYYFSKDARGTTTCYGQCAVNWPPYMATDGLRVDAAESQAGMATGTLSVITRADGTEQLTYAGWPLYYWKDDVAPGDVNGHGVNKVWAIARPNGAFDLSTSSPTSMQIDENAKIFNITGKMFSFSQTEMRVKKGDTVTVNFESTEGLHDWVVDEFDAATAQVRPGTKTSVTFVAEKVGTFEYYCAVGQHRQMGMVGKLIVE